jgi:predicted amidohydrolase YtcJ
MTTRATPAGVLGPEHAITRQEALRLYTVAGARFLGGETAGALVPGAPADLAAYRADPFTCPGEQLPGLSPAVTVINGQLAYRGLDPGTAATAATTAPQSPRPGPAIA